MTYGYQDAGVQFLRAHGRAILGDDPGLGKSRQALLAAEGRCLVIAPAMILDAGVWQHEHATWSPDLDLRSVSYSSVAARQERKVLPRPKPEWAGPWDTVICDEAHYLKGRKTNWTEAVSRINTERLYLLTGTAIPNWAHEIYMLLRLCHPGDRRFSSYWRWIAQWFHINQVSRRGHMVREIGGLLACGPACDQLEGCEHWVEFQRQNLADCFLRRVRDDVLADLPPLVEETLAVPMEPAQRKIYNQLKADFIAWTESGAELVAWSNAAQLVQLAKVCTGVEILDPTSPSSGKLRLVRELLAERAGSPTLLVHHFQATGQALMAIADEMGLAPVAVNGRTSKLERKRAVDRFQAGEHGVLVGSIEAIKEGLTLTRADGVVFVEHSWRPSSNEQAMRRVHRIGQHRPVTVYHLVTKGTVDARMQRVLRAKTDQQVKALPVQRVAELV